MKTKVNWDGLGIITSVACAIHCAILPLIATSLPMFGINIIHNTIFEWSMICIAFGVGLYALYHGFTKHHRSLIPVYIFVAGIGFLIAKQVFHQVEILLLLPAVLLITGAHYYNYILCNKAKCHTVPAAH